MTNNISLIDPRPCFTRAAAVTRGVLDGVTAEQMADPTPCGNYDVRALMNHLVMVMQRVAVLGSFGDVMSVSEDLEVAVGAHGAAWSTAEADAAVAWDRPDALTTMVRVPWAELTGADAVAIYTNEIVVHTWELAVATEQSADWDEEVVDVSFAAIRTQMPAEGRVELFEAFTAELPAGASFEPPFAAAVTVPDDAPAIDRLVAWNGRDPHWTPAR